MRKMTDPISEWTLKECINALKRMDADLLEYGYAIYIADRIHDLTRWIPVSERMPTEADGYKSKYVTQRTVLVVEKWGDISVVTIGLAKHFTHWKCITPPDNKP
jgi:hypothetical protein